MSQSWISQSTGIANASYDHIDLARATGGGFHRYFIKGSALDFPLPLGERYATF